MGMVCGTKPQKDTISKQTRAKIGVFRPFCGGPMFALVPQGVGRRSTLNEVRRSVIQPSIDCRSLEADWRSTNHTGLPLWLAEGLPRSAQLYDRQNWIRST